MMIFYTKAFFKNDIKRRYEKFIKILFEKNEDYPDYVKIENESVIVKKFYINE